MIGTEFLKGQGLGNRLFCYITARCLAADLGAVFGTAGQEYLDAPFLDLDLGEKIEDPSRFGRYDEAERRLYLENSPHDMIHGCYTAGADEKLLARGADALGDDTLIYGNLQAEQYFDAHRDEIREWLKVKTEYDSHEFSRDDLCIINVRGGEYADDPALFLNASYFRNAMKWMKKKYPGISFMIVTDDEEAASKLLPEVQAHHFDPAKDYVTVKNAHHLIISNSSFAFFPAYTSETVQEVIAPKYWARHNVSDGYWASEQNIYSGFLYMDRQGNVSGADECRKELASYRYPRTSAFAPDDPQVEKIRKRNERKRLMQKAAAKARRLLQGKA